MRELDIPVAAFILLGAGALAGVTLADCGTSSSTSPPSQGSIVHPSVATTATYHSRPDLKPPRIATRKGAGTPAPGLICVTPAGPLLVDNAGEPVWIHPVPHAATNLRVQQYQGRRVLTWWQGEVAHYGVGLHGEYVVVDDSYRTITTVKAHHGLAADLHEFIIDANGIAYFTAYRHYSADLTSVGGPKKGTALDATVQGVDLSTGALVFDWHSADHISFDESHARYSKGVPYDPVHLNSVDFTPDGKLLFSARNTWCIYKVDPASGAIVWRLGGKKSDFDLGPGVRFAWQHDARTHADGTISLFDDEADPPEARQSRGLIVDVDEVAMKATLHRHYRHPNKRLLAGSQGSLQILPAGNVFMGWGAEPYYTELQEDGIPVLDARFATGTSYRAFRFEWSGTPTELPALAVKDEDGQMTAYVSWNGSTETTQWQLLGGPSADALQPTALVARNGFETPLAVAPGTAYVAVVALGEGGTALGRSAPMRV